MRHSLLLGLVALAAVAAAACPGPSANGTCPNDLPSTSGCSAVPSWDASVASVFVTRCVPCHYAGNPGVRFPMDSYANVSLERSACLDQIYTCRMPPADAGSAFALGSGERQAVLTWLVCGAPNN